MAGIPQNFQAFSNVLANYDFVDIASGTGYINFYAGNTIDIKQLSNFTYYSENIYTDVTCANVAPAQLLSDLDFDVVMNRPLDVKGLGIVNVPIGAAGSTAYVYSVVTLRKVTGGVESDICTNNSSTKTITAGQAYMTSIDLNIPLTHYKIGDTLRLNISVWGYASNAANKDVKLGNDPIGRTTDGIKVFDVTGAVPTKLMFQCPVRLNL